MDSKQVGKRIKERRTELGRTLQEVADEVKVNKSTIQRYESGNVVDLKLPVIESIAKYLNVDPLWIIGKIENKRRSEEFERATHLIDVYFRGVMVWSDNQFLNERETVIIREHFSELLSRYKQIIEGFVNSKFQWEASEESFSESHKNRLSNEDIRALFLKHELDHSIKIATNLLESLPTRIAWNECNVIVDNEKENNEPQ